LVGLRCRAAQIKSGRRSSTALPQNLEGQFPEMSRQGEETPLFFAKPFKEKGRVVNFARPSVMVWI
jgi:hypothetical protein